MAETLSVLTFVAELDPRSSSANVERLDAAAAAAGEPADPPERRVAVLPERFWRDDDECAYREAVAAFAGRHACRVVGGSMHAERPDGITLNTGVVAGPDGSLAGAYSKRHPFAAEALAGVVPGDGPAAFDFGGVRAAVCICADLFDPALFAACGEDCAAILVCAASTSRKPDPSFARGLWTHVAVARAWERNAYVAISDWAHAPHFPGVRTSGVSGLADPSRPAPPFFTATPAPAAWFRLELEPLRRLAQDRLSRNFLWR
jgi:predicted amidohydrolase